MPPESSAATQVAEARPEPMPVDIEQWASTLDFTNFANASAQFRDIASLGPIKRILIIGPGQGLDTAIFRWRGHDVVTFDIDDRLKPDVIGSAHDLSMFADKSFDAIIASHVVEHIPPAYLDRVIDELARVADHSLVYLPIAGRTIRMRFMPGVRGWDWTWALDLFNPFDRPDPNRPKYCALQHYWEIGRPGYSKRQVMERFNRRFQIRSAYRNPDWLPSFNMVMTARQDEANV